MLDVGTVSISGNFKKHPSVYTDDFTIYIVIIHQEKDPLGCLLILSGLFMGTCLSPQSSLETSDSFDVDYSTLSSLDIN